MNNMKLIFNDTVAIWMIIFLLSGLAYAAQPVAGSRTTTAMPAQPTGITTKPAQQPVTNVGGSMTPCANYCDKVNNKKIEQKPGVGGCQQTKSTDCFPYKCNYQGTDCIFSCTGNAQCAIPNAYCNQAMGKCIPGNNCKSKCEGDNKAEYLPTAMLPNSVDCKKDKITSCFPYSCDPQSGTCRYNCTSDQQCANGAMCSDTKSCVPAYNHCDKDYPNILILADRTKVDCAPYLCRGGVCLTSCTKTAGDCIPGYVCDTYYGIGPCIPQDTK